MAARTPIIAIVGRPNVGKSTLFNRIAGERLAIVEDVPGVTRDRISATVGHFSIPFVLFDTGGFEVDAEESLKQQIAEQALLAAEEADAVIAVFDGKSGLHPGDEDVVSLLRRYDKPVAYVVNKCDGDEQVMRTAEFYELGVPELFDCSALHGRNVKSLVETILALIPDYEDLLQTAVSMREQEDLRERELEWELEEQEFEELDAQDEVLDSGERPLPVSVDFAEENEEVEFAPVYRPGESDLSASEYDRRYRLGDELLVRNVDLSEPDDSWIEDEDLPLERGAEDSKPPECIRLAILGRPNVGKSTLLNSLIGEKRVLTSPEAGTTRDAIDVTVTRNGQVYTVIDTAGLRKKSRISTKLERYSTLRSLKALSQCDVALVLIDATVGPEEQDSKIVGLAHEQGKGIIIVVNKWDLIKKDHKTVSEFRQRVKDAFKFALYAPIVFISALSGRRCEKLLEEAREIAVERAKWVPTSKLNKVLHEALSRHTLPVYRGRPVRLLYAAQVSACPPQFALFFNFPKEVHFSFIRYMRNAIREEFGFDGSDLRFSLRRRNPIGRKT